MKCPACRVALLTVEHEGIELDVCATCRGTWFDAEELDLLLESAGFEDCAHTLDMKLGALAAHPPPSPRLCPRCHKKLEEIRVDRRGGVVAVARCARGDGYWFDRPELPLVVDAMMEGAGGPLQKLQDYLAGYTGQKKDQR